VTQANWPHENGWGYTKSAVLNACGTWQLLPTKALRLTVPGNREMWRKRGAKSETTRDYNEV
jgi:hypothetical protein